MDLIRKYGDITKRSLINPEKTFSYIKLGAQLQHIRWANFPNNAYPKSLQYLNKISFKYILEPLKHPKKAAFANLFAPTEILHAFNIYPLFVEGFSTFLSGLYCEDYLINIAEDTGISETLCSYHKAFIGAVEAGIIPKLNFSITSSMICDANINTFRHISKKYSIPHYVIDIPYKYSKESEEYVAKQLIEMTEMIEDIMKVKLDLEKLKNIIDIENSTKIYMKKYLKSLYTKYFPNTLTLEMSKLILSHIGMGREETYNFYKMISEEIHTYPDRKGKAVFWVHILPIYEETLRHYFNFNENLQLLGCDLNFDHLEELDRNKPFNALAKKMLINIYNGSYEKKIETINKLIDDTNADGVLHFCHWGCKQANGGTNMLKESLKAKNIPYISIDGDGVDRRNSHSGQIKTRFEAFLEMLNSQ